MTQTQSLKQSLKHIRLAWRATLPKYEQDEAFARLVAFVREHAAVVDEVALFDSSTHHVYIPLDVYERRAALIAQRLRALKEAGVPNVGINVLATLGHLNEAWDTMPPMPFQPMVGHDGDVSTGCACPNTPELRAYVCARYTLVAQAAPDFVWVDDDIRMQHHGVAFACFCPTCLREFAEMTGERFTRESLVQALSDPAGGTVRCAWVEQNIRSIESLLAEVGAAVHTANPAIDMRLMTAGADWSTYSGVAFERWVTALKGSMVRLAGGFYSDANRLEVLDKAFDVGRQRAAMPSTVRDYEYEMENFPYQLLKKSATSVMNECTLALAVGLNGIAFDALGMWEGALDEYAPTARRAEQTRPLWERLVAQTAGLPTAGLWVAWSPHLMARRQVRPGEDWFVADRRYDFTCAHALAQIGLPLNVDRPGAATVWCGRVAEAFGDEELLAMLSGGVLMDTAALDVLTERGLGHLAGVRIVRRIDNGVMERFTTDPLNGAYTGEVRDARIEFWGDARGMADVLAPLDTAVGVRILAGMEDYLRRAIGPCMTAYENALGGRVVVMGYAPWMYIHTAPKRAQLLNVADWVTRGSLPVRIDEAVPLTPFVRLSADGTCGAVVLLNTGLEPIERVTLHLRTQPTAQVVLATAAGMRPLAAQPEPGGCSVVLDAIGPWETAVLFLGQSES